MGNSTPAQPNIRKLILVPSIITLAVTMIRLTGELAHGSQALFNSAVGGPGALIGITWLAPVFGIYFAARLVLSGQAPRSTWRAIAYGLLGIAVGIGSFRVGGLFHVDRSFYVRLVYIWFAFALAGLVTWPGWPLLFKTLAAYAYAARIPVALIMLLAIYGNWGTHYDVAPGDMPAMGWFAKWVWIGFFPQLMLWVGFTLATGMFFGALASGVIRLVRRPTEVGQ